MPMGKLSHVDLLFVASAADSHFGNRCGRFLCPEPVTLAHWLQDVQELTRLLQVTSEAKPYSRTASVQVNLRDISTLATGHGNSLTQNPSYPAC